MTLQGWECPKCNGVFAPTQPSCLNCKGTQPFKAPSPLKDLETKDLETKQRPPDFALRKCSCGAPYGSLHGCPAIKGPYWGIY